MDPILLTPRSSLYLPPSNAIPSLRAAYGYKSPWLDRKTVLDQNTGLGDERDEQPGRGLLFNGTNQHASFANSYDIGTGDFSISLWYLMPVTGRHFFVSRSGSDSYFELQNGTKLSVRGTGGVSAASSDLTILAGFNHFSVSRNAGVVSFFHNGQLVGTEAFGTDFGVDALNTTFGSGSLQMSSTLSNLRIYNRALTQVEIAAQHEQGTTSRDKIVPGVPTDHVIGFDCNNNSTTVEKNTGSLGSDYDATIVNGSQAILYEGPDVPFNRQNLVGYSENLVAQDYRDWVSSGNVSLSENNIVFSGATTGHYAQFFAGLTTSDSVRVQFDYVITSGVIQIKLAAHGAGGANTAVSDTGSFDGTYSPLAAGGNMVFRAGGGTTNATITNVRVTVEGKTVPLKANDLTQDVLGNLRQFTGLVPRHKRLVNSPCLTLDGTNDYVSVPTLGVSGSQNRTFCGWFKVSKIQRAFFTFGDSGAGEKWTIRTSDKKLTPRIEIEFSFHESDLTIQPDEWTFIACVLNGTTLGDHTLWVGDQSEQVVGSNPVNTVDRDYGIGINNLASTPIAILEGSCQLARFYDKALTPIELEFVRTYGASGTNPTKDNLLFDYNFEENALETIYDRSGNENHGTLINATESAAWGQTTDERHDNIELGFSKYTHATGRTLQVPFANGSPQTITIPAGYTLDGHYPAINGHNGAATEIDFSNYNNAPAFEGLVLPSNFHPDTHVLGSDDLTYRENADGTVDRFHIQ